MSKKIGKNRNLTACRVDICDLIKVKEKLFECVTFQVRLAFDYNNNNLDRFHCT